jgi:ATP adenylyltransferase C-terminal domain
VSECLRVLECQGAPSHLTRKERSEGAAWRRRILWNLLTRPDFLGVQINAVGFAGSLYVRDDAQLATVKRVRPMAVLSKVTCDE